MTKAAIKEQLFTSAPINKAIISLAVPTIIAQLITVVYNMADTFFIGQLNDANQVAAATFAMPVFMLLTAFANLFGIGGASTISRFLGANNKEKAKQTASFCILTATFVALLYGIIVIVLKKPILSILGTDEKTADFCASYILWTVGIGAVPTVLNAELAHLIRAEGYSLQAGFGVILGGILNIILDPIFIFVFKLEITGAAIATMLSNVIATLFFLCFLFKIRKNTTITPSPEFFTLKEGIPAEVITVGLPGCLMTMLSTVSNLTLNKIISNYSNEAVAGMGIAKKIDLLAFAIAQGLTQGVLPLIAYNFSSGNHKRMLKALKVMLIYCLLISFAGMALMFFAAKPLTRCFIDNAATIECGQTFLQILCLACPTTALNFLAITIFQATGKKIQPLFLTVLRKGGLDIPLMLILNNFSGINGIAWATPLADIAAFILATILVIPYLKKISTNQQQNITK